MKFTLVKNQQEVEVNEDQICYQMTIMEDGQEYTQLHLSNGEILTGTASDNDAK